MYEWKIEENQEMLKEEVTKKWSKERSFEGR